MGIGAASLIEVSLEMLADNQQTMNVYQYRVSSYTGSAGAPEIAEAWWNHVLTTYRALVVTTTTRIFNEVTVRELNAPTGALATWGIPAAEEDGTRSAGSLGSFLATFMAVGVRLNVGTRVTRPGQKRIWGLTEGDVAGNNISATYIGLVEDLMDVALSTITLGAPAALVELTPIVCRKDSTGAVTASQDVMSYTINPLVTSQVSRKVGRGS